MTEERFNELVLMVKDQGVRLRSVEDFILGRVNTFLELSNSLKERVEVLESHDAEFMAMVHSTCDIKNKEIQEAREKAIEISCNHADKNHVQTWKVLAFIATVLISCITYFNIENNARALDIKKHETQIDNISKTLDKIDSKMDRLMSHVANEDK